MHANPQARAAGDRVNPYWQGFIASVPLQLSLIPIALTFGARVAECEVSNIAGWSASWLIFAGSAQLAVLDIVDTGGASVFAVVAGLIVNARHLMYSATAADHFREEPLSRRLATAYVLTDEAYALLARKGGTRPAFPDFHWRYYASAGLSMWAVVLATTGVGVIAAAALPAALPAQLVGPLCFTGLAAPLIVSRGTAASAAAGVLAGVGLGWLPFGAGLVVAAVAGAGAGAAVTKDGS